MKALGQVFTPIHIVKRILKELQFENILNKKTLEPSFGEGVFLMEIIRKYIEEAKNNHLSSKEIKYILEQNIWGIEIDTTLYNNTVNNINNYLSSIGLENVTMHLYNMDALDFTESNFDYIIGNPPYLRIHDIDNLTREKIKDYSFSKGNTDLYIIFFEMCIKKMAKNGKLGFITPNSFLRNTSQKLFRNYLIGENNVEKIIDFGANKVFNNIDTYTTITILNKNKEYTTYISSNNIEDIYSIKVDLHNYKDKEWSFGNSFEKLFLEDVQKKPNLFDDNYSIQYGFATNADKIYIGNYEKIDATYGSFNGIKMENNILIDIVKGAKYDGTITKKAIFPYRMENEKYVAYTENELKQKFPLCFSYLLSHKKELSERNIEKNRNWYEYARSQSINSFNKEKLLIKHIIGPNDEIVSISKLDKNVAVYSGIYITAKNKSSLDVIKSVLEDKDFCTYCKIVGKDMSGGYKSISPKHVKNYKYEVK